jgi:hypothetical protein
MDDDMNPLEFLISLPSFEDLDRVDGSQVGVPSVNATISISAWRTFDVPHKLELEKVWLHVEGFPHIVHHFLGMWAVGSLLGKTSDVDFLSLRGGGVVSILVAMFNFKVLDKSVDDLGAFAKSDVVAKLKGYEFRFRREPTSVVPNPNFVSFVWEKKNDGNGGWGCGRRRGRCYVYF